MKRSFFLMCSWLFATASMASPGDLQDSARARVAQGVKACGLEVWSGQDPRLPSAIRNRMVDDVIVRVLSNGAVIPGILIDQKIIDSHDDEVSLIYMTIHGSYLFRLERDFRQNDLTVWTRELGMTAYSQTSLTGDGPITRFYVRPAHQTVRSVNASAFLNFINTELADSFVSWMCDYK